MDRSRVVITGATGQLGTAFRGVLPEAIFLDRSRLDLSVPSSVPDVLRALSPSAVINCAAYTAVDKAEAEEELATRINGESVGEMARICAELGIPFVTFSTDYVFDGASEVGYVESDPTSPVNAYGRSKLVGERLALEANPSALIIRTSWVISSTHDNFVSTMLRLASVPDSTLKVVDDQRACPTIADDLAAASWTVLLAGATGTRHLANAGATTWYHLARSAVASAGLDPEVVEPCDTSEYPTPARRPQHSVLGSERLDQPSMPRWEASLAPLVAHQVARMQADGTLQMS